MIMYRPFQVLEIMELPGGKIQISWIVRSLIPFKECLRSGKTMEILEKNPNMSILRKMTSWTKWRRFPMLIGINNWNHHNLELRCFTENQVLSKHLIQENWLGNNQKDLQGQLNLKVILQVPYRGKWRLQIWWLETITIIIHPLTPIIGKNQDNSQNLATIWLKLKNRHILQGWLCKAVCFRRQNRPHEEEIKVLLHLTWKIAIFLNLSQWIQITTKQWIWEVVFWSKIV